MYLDVDEASDHIDRDSTTDQDLDQTGANRKKNTSEIVMSDSQVICNIGLARTDCHFTELAKLNL
ncbi:hypothetical protein EPI10_032443 [Gossypium australe]|uniref:Uncharacterized protein n=1 Tax=Gossypium australe TaxID=47621 RepID=A0A5B6X750_9ROSI|nr:hypothetical protein EPI10_032443 [Gossypium australe]